MARLAIIAISIPIKQTTLSLRFGTESSLPAELKIAVAAKNPKTISAVIEATFISTLFGGLKRCSKTIAQITIAIKGSISGMIEESYDFDFSVFVIFVN